jgi:putative transposase
MTENKNRHSHRLPDFDYSQPGAYFITIVTFKRACSFGEIKNGVMVCNALGDFARWEWERSYHSR